MPPRDAIRRPRAHRHDPVTRFDFDPTRSRVWIEARSSLHPIHSETAGLQGWFDADVGVDGRIDTTVTPHARLELAVERMSSGNPLYDREMRRRIDARRYPTISGQLTFLKPAGGEGRYLVGGEITFRGVTNHYEHEMGITAVDDATLKFEGERTFDIRDFGMEPPRILALRVYPDVAVRVEIIASAS
jgi:polyisoprenoid-binding protein YceI